MSATVAAGASHPIMHPGTVQDAWYARNRGHPVVARLTDGKTISGTLASWDSYTLTLLIAERAEPALVFKQAIAFLIRKAS